MSPEQALNVANNLSIIAISILILIFAYGGYIVYRFVKVQRELKLRETIGFQELMAKHSPEKLREEILKNDRYRRKN